MGELIAINNLKHLSIYLDYPFNRITFTSATAMKRLRKTKTMTPELKNELLMYVLDRTPIWLFNIATREFSTQKIYSRFKRELMSDYSELMPCELKYAVVMSEVFGDYNCEEIRCTELRSKIALLKYKAKLYKKTNPLQYSTAVDDHNATVEEYSKLIAPQNRLIKLYKSIQSKAVK